MSSRHLRDLPLFWKVMLPFLALIVVFGTIGSFLIVRDLTVRAQDSLDQDLARRSFEARSLAHDRELYLVESVNFATNIQGMPRAIASRDRDAIERLLGSVLVLKSDINLLVATDARGVGLVESRREVSSARPRLASGRRWDATGFVNEALHDTTGRRHAGSLRDGRRTFLAIAAPICSQARSCVARGVAIVGIDIAALARDIASKITLEGPKGAGGAAIFDAHGRLLASSRLAGGTVAPTLPADGSPARTTTRVRGVTLSTMFAPFDVQGEHVGSIAVTIPATGRLAAVRRTAINIALIVLAVMAGVIAVGAIVSRFITAQLRPLIDTNRALGRGELTARAPVVSEDELGELARGVNQMAEQLQASYETLEFRVLQRTEEVQRLLQERTEFFASLSHDLRTPLAVIRSQALMMLDPKFSMHSPADTAKAIVQSSDQLLTAINELLELARAEAGRLDVSIESVRVRDVVKDVRGTLEGLARAGDITLKIDLPRDLPSVNADPRRLREVLLNLVDNAVKYTPSGGVVRVRGLVQNGAVHLEVHDTGVGIPESDREKIFEPFYRVKGNETQRGQASSGLGLALTKRLIEAQGGEITFESRSGAGTTFTVSLPRAERA